MATPPPTEPTSLCVGSLKDVCAGWLCVFEGTEEECRRHFENGRISDEYDHVFMINSYRETTLR
jgi:hypothetical protein